MSRAGLAKLTLALAGWAAGAAAAPKFALQFHYDKDGEELRLFDVRFVSARRGIAIGLIESEARRRGVLVESSDGGVTWAVTPFRELPRSIFFLDESLGWIVAEGGIWMTEEGGRSWRKIRSERSLLRVHFFDAQKGFAVGIGRQFLRTADGGKTWSKVPEAEKAGANPNLVFSGITFANPRQGMVSGYAPAPRRGAELPAWMEPEEAARRVQLPGVVALLSTSDGGVTWSAQLGSVFGRVTDIRMQANQTGLALMQFDDAFQYPGEVFRLTGTGSSERVFREKDRLMTSVVFDGEGTAWMAGIEPPLKIRGAAIPGPVKVVRATGPQYNVWQPIAVDYHANANRVSVSVSPEGVLWAVTDTGMILRLAD